jgi:hypothetical protein
MQSQMAACKTDVRTYTLQFEAEPDRVWTVEQSKIQFAGWKMLEPTKDDVKDSVYWTAWSTFAKAGTKLVWTTLAGHERFTKPSPRYTEASLVRDLERKGIGRPSTFASLIATLQERDYVEKTNVEGKEQETHHLLINTPSTWPPKEEVIKHTVGAEKNKLRVTPIGREAIQFLAKEFNDLLATRLSIETMQYELPRKFPYFNTFRHNYIIPLSVKFRGHRHIDLADLAETNEVFRNGFLDSYKAIFVEGCHIKREKRPSGQIAKKDTEARRMYIHLLVDLWTMLGLFFSN